MTFFFFFFLQDYVKYNYIKERLCRNKKDFSFFSEIWPNILKFSVSLRKIEHKNLRKMEISGEQVTTKSTRKRTIIVIVAILLIGCATCYFVSQYGFSQKLHRQPYFFDRQKIDLSDTDISIFVIGDSDNTPNPDLRTKYWEDQIESIGKNITVRYVADRQIKGSTKRWIIPEILRKYEPHDPNYCERTIEAWKYFALHEKTKKWYFQARQGTFINLKNLISLISDLDTKINPKKEAYFQYAAAETLESNHAIHPAANSGFLISNAALLSMFNRLDHFTYSCSRFGDEIALGQMILNMNLEVKDFINHHFISNWPNETKAIIFDQDKDAQDKLVKCPSKQFRFSEQIQVDFDDPSYFVAADTPNGIPMDSAKSTLTDLFIKDLYIGYPTDNKPIFCLK